MYGEKNERVSPSRVEMSDWGRVQIVYLLTGSKMHLEAQAKGIISGGKGGDKFNHNNTRFFLTDILEVSRDEQGVWFVVTDHENFYTCRNDFTIYCDHKEEIDD